MGNKIVLGIDLGSASVRVKSCKVLKKVYHPLNENIKIYKKLYSIYNILHDAFGVKGNKIALYSVVKELLMLKRVKG